MSSDAAVDPVAEIHSPAPASTKDKKPRASRAPKKEKDTTSADATDKKDDTKSDSKEKGTKKKGTGTSHPPFEDIIRECISTSWID